MRGNNGGYSLGTAPDDPLNWYTQYSPNILFDHSQNHPGGCLWTHEDNDCPGTGNNQGGTLSSVEDPARTVTFFEGNNWNVVLACSTVTTSTTAPYSGLPMFDCNQGDVIARHLETGNFLFADGHVKALRLDEVAKSYTSTATLHPPSGQLRYPYFTKASD